MLYLERHFTVEAPCVTADVVVAGFHSLCRFGWVLAVEEPFDFTILSGL